MEAAGFTGIASDSREVKPGFLFAAIPGTRTDGAEFLKDAVGRGAAAVLGKPEIAARAQALGVRFIPDANPRLALARAASAFFAAQPGTVAAVTGTNGKTSITVFLREIWTALGKPAASMGTIGLVTPKAATVLHHTTPGPVELHRLLAELKHDGVNHLAIEASSHGLDQYRLHAVDVAAVGFTNITRDHMDYHPTFEAYLACKLRLFREIARDGAVAVVNADSDNAADFVAAAQDRRLRLLTVGEEGQTLRLAARTPHGDGQRLAVEHAGRRLDVDLPLAGAFQASNALMAAGFAIGLGEDATAVFEALGELRGAPGRLEKVAAAKNGAPVYVDYAHTPDALENVLTALRPHTRGKLSIVFGCGGDRDKGKRPLMGAAAARLADRVIVTDDNPRSEDAAQIRREILACCTGAAEIGDRGEAIRAGIAALGAADALVIAGKGHESGQIVGATVHPFSDREEAIKAAESLGGHAAERAP
ncbi:MAG: UDP-N-acetylmuramoyl-L-alanyl-D-glutamate--2,6-diaminopimelate ligase [Alphaproteobacteria bacterium]|nr:UDP-N-acetylmuramoyl-L-alanyl-D-glutamate--2,6-diaminopimelate ligase [Alphaproteobacteria bacterium]